MAGKTLASIKAGRNAKLVKIIVFVTIALLLLMIFAWIYNKMTLNNRNCTTMNNLYKDFPLLSTLNRANKQFRYNLRDYYVKTAFNCCTAGEYKNDFVNVCALKNCIKQGARCLDFEIYSVNNKPVISVSSVEDFTVKETYNSIPFGTAMGIIADYAFSGSTSPCPGDPLIIHLRIMSNNQTIYTQMADDLYNTLESRLLSKEYSYENQGKNIGSTPLTDFMEKVIVVVDKTNALFEKTPLDEYVNIASNSIFMRSLRYHDVKYTPDMQELIDFNKKNMSICIPDLSSEAENPSPSLAMKYGCQMVAMAFQNFDENMQYYDEFFDDAGSAFVLKPESLRYIPVTINVPPPPPEAYSYKKRSVKSDYYAFTI